MENVLQVGDVVYVRSGRTDYTKLTVTRVTPKTAILTSGYKCKREPGSDGVYTLIGTGNYGPFSVRQINDEIRHWQRKTVLNQLVSDLKRTIDLMAQAAADPAMMEQQIALVTALNAVSTGKFLAGWYTPDVLPQVESNSVKQCIVITELGNIGFDCFVGSGIFDGNPGWQKYKSASDPIALWTEFPSLP